MFRRLDLGFAESGFCTVARGAEQLGDNDQTKPNITRLKVADEKEAKRHDPRAYTISPMFMTGIEQRELY